MNLLKRIKLTWTKYLENLAEENKKSFGTGRLDCCQLNNKNNKNNKNN